MVKIFPKVGDLFMEETALDRDAVRELMYFKAIDIGIDEELAQELDDALCAFLGIEDPEPIIAPL